MKIMQKKNLKNINRVRVQLKQKILIRDKPFHLAKSRRKVPLGKYFCEQTDFFFAGILHQKVVYRSKKCGNVCLALIGPDQ